MAPAAVLRILVQAPQNGLTSGSPTRIIGRGGNPSVLGSTRGYFLRTDDEGGSLFLRLLRRLEQDLGFGTRAVFRRACVASLCPKSEGI
jgi:hypothetical protein